MSPLEVSLAVKPVAGLRAAVGKPKQRPHGGDGRIGAEEDARQGSRDLAVRPISNGVQVHLEVEQGLVRLFGRLVVMGMEHRSAAAPQ